MNIRVYCSCGTELKIGGRSQVDALCDLRLEAEPCSNKKCDKGFCADCEDLTNKHELEKENKRLKEQIR